ncbi:MAG: MFS transporter [Chloroflexi bacterium]|nr:MFS transporter [Chloroflexota bacterium]
MIKRTKSPRIFFGWWTVLTSGIIGLWGYGFQSYGFSALFKPIAAELGFNRAVTSVAASIGRFEGGFEAPLSGWITDRYGPRWVVLPGIFLAGLGLVLMYYVNSLWAFYLVWGGLLGTGINVALGVPLDTTISNWFVKKRGLALSIKMVFQGLSGVAVLPLVAWLITQRGWRETCAIGGVVLWLIGLPLAWLFLKQRRPEYYGLLPDGATDREKTRDQTRMLERGVQYAAEAQEVEFSLREALRTRTYWLLMVINSVPALVAPVMNIHGIPFLTDMGIDPLKAAVMMSIYVGTSVPFRFIGGVVADRLNIQRLPWFIGGTFLLQSIGIVIYLLSPSIMTIYVWFVLYGAGMGLHQPATPLLRARYFGRKAFGSIQGTTTLLMTPIGVLAPILTGWIYDTRGSYTMAFIMLAGAFIVTGFLFPILKPPKRPAQIGDVRKIM